MTSLISEIPTVSSKQGLVESLERLVRAYYQQPSPRDATRRRVGVSSAILGPEEAIGVLRTVLSGWITQGQVTAQFEREFAEYIGVKHAIAVNSGSSANLVALAALIEADRLPVGDEVIVPATTFATVAAPLIQLGLVPVYVDVCADTYNLDPQAVEAAISPKTAAIMPVHTVGHPADLSAVLRIAQRHNLCVIEDCCESHGSSLDGRKVGSFGAINTFSFFVAHNMTTGEGGMIVTDDEPLAILCRSLREFGRVDQRDIAQERFYSDGVLNEYDKRYVFQRPGYNVRMTDVAAAMGIEQLRKLDVFNARRRDNAAFYRAALLRSCADVLEPAIERPGAFHTYYTYAMTIRPGAPFTRRQLVDHLESHGIETRPIFAGCLPDQPGFRQAPHRIVGALPVARWIRDWSLFLGVHPGVSDEDRQHVVQTIESFVKAQPG